MRSMTSTLLAAILSAIIGVSPASTESQSLAGQRRALDQRAQFRPRNLRMRTAAKTAIGAGDDVFLADKTRIALQALRHQLRMLDHVGRMGDDAGDENLSRRQLDLVPRR